jgi:hypothetical protein
MMATIKIDSQTKRALDSLKVHPRQPYYEVIQGLIRSHEEAVE